MIAAPRPPRDGARSFEPRDVPPRWVAAGLAGVCALLGLSIAGVTGFVGASKPRAPSPAPAAHARFHTAGPPLESAPRAGREALERAHPAPDADRLQAAIDAVVRRGWTGPGEPVR